ncbi:acetone carboxylase subunit gamma [Amycolatopsis jejuensis]|uniref:acetone carboxylase subunit gamma n=1 Tax=Amycolatopsis jejuensis TaxID=330084 RepID=UPI001FE130F4|nr:acetone carboxylase subunit gamma [Amycolatopsis jejuensis]
MPEPPAPALPDGHRWLDENIVIAEDGTSACGRCRHRLADPQANYKLGTHVVETPLSATDRVWRDPALYVDETSLVFREFVCPGCGCRLETEVSLRELPPVHDKQLALTWR